MKRNILNFVENGAEMSELAIVGRASHDITLVGRFSVLALCYQLARSDMLYRLLRALSGVV